MANIADDAFLDQVLSCAESISKNLRRSITRYDSEVALAGLAEYLGQALRICIDAQVCTIESARSALTRVEAAAFTRGDMAPVSSRYPALH